MTKQIPLIDLLASHGYIEDDYFQHHKHSQAVRAGNVLKP